MSTQTCLVREVEPTEADLFRKFIQSAQQSAYPRPELGITEDLFSDAQFDRPEIVEFYQRICAQGEHGKAWVAEDASGILGTIAVSREESYCELQSFYVAPDLKGKGIGRSLFAKVLEFANASPIRLDVIEYMEDTIGIYEHWGFVTDYAAGRPDYIQKWWPEEARCAFAGIYMFRGGRTSDSMRE